MNKKDIRDVDLPFHVVTSDGTFHSGHEYEAAAKSRADRANEDAKALGLSVTYDVKEV